MPPARGVLSRATASQTYFPKAPSSGHSQHYTAAAACATRHRACLLSLYPQMYTFVIRPVQKKLHIFLPNFCVLFYDVLMFGKSCGTCRIPEYVRPRREPRSFLYPDPFPGFWTCPWCLHPPFFFQNHSVHHTPLTTSKHHSFSSGVLQCLMSHSVPKWSTIHYMCFQPKICSSFNCHLSGPIS